MKTFFEFILGLLILLLGVGLSGLIFGFPIMWLWNWLMPALFGLTKITYWQSVGVVIFTRFIFSNVTKYEYK